MILENYHKECQARTPAPTQSSSFTRVKFQIIDGNMAATAGSFAKSGRKKKKSIKQGSYLEAVTYKYTWIVELQQKVC